MGLRLSEAKTKVVHLSEGFDFLGFRIQWRRKQGTRKHYVYTFIDDRPIRSLKAKIRALTPRTSQLDLGYVLTRPANVVKLDETSSAKNTAMPPVGARPRNPPAA